MREFTEIERGINAGLIERYLEILRRSLAKFADVRAGLRAPWRTTPATSAASPRASRC